jgi:hypothetical protein
VSDDERWQPFKGSSPKTVAVPGETFWTLVSDHVIWSCELRFRGEDYGWGARLLRSGDFFASQRFMIRAAAEIWANEMADADVAARSTSPANSAKDEGRDSV